LVFETNYLAANHAAVFQANGVSDNWSNESKYDYEGA
jgi:hypothetical protein